MLLPGPFLVSNRAANVLAKLILICFESLFLPQNVPSHVSQLHSTLKPTETDLSIAIATCPLIAKLAPFLVKIPLRL